MASGTGRVVKYVFLSYLYIGVAGSLCKRGFAVKSRQAIVRGCKTRRAVAEK